RGAAGRLAEVARGGHAEGGLPVLEVVHQGGQVGAGEGERLHVVGDLAEHRAGPNRGVDGVARDLLVGGARPPLLLGAVGEQLDRVAGNAQHPAGEVVAGEQLEGGAGDVGGGEAVGQADLEGGG